MDIGETHRLQLAHRPVASAGLGLGRGKRWPTSVVRPFGDVPGIMVVVERIVAQRGDPGVGDHRWRGSAGLLREGRGGGSKQQRGKECVSSAVA